MDDEEDFEIDLGLLGQDQFKTWCSNNGLSAVASNPDRFGWDFFVEFEPKIDTSIPLDRQGELIKVFVQVKATQTSSQSVRAKLSALKRLVFTDLPAFMMHLEYGADTTRPSRARLLHIGAAEIEQILRKVRETERSGRTDLHNVTLSLPLSDAIEVDADGRKLRLHLRVANATDLTAYATNKANLRKTCGNSVVMNFVADEKSMVDLMLGYVTDIPLSDLSIAHSRFGIMLQNDIERFSEGRLSVEVKPMRRERAWVLHKSGKRSPSLDIEVIAPGIPDISVETAVIRLRNEFLDVALNLGQGTCKVRFHIEPDKRLPLDRLADALAFAVAMSEQGAVIEHSLGTGTSGIELTTEFEAYASSRVLSEFVEMLAIAVFRHRRNKPVEVTLLEMIKALNDNRSMYALLTRPGLELTGRFHKLPPNGLPTERAIYMPIGLIFADLADYAIAKATARATLDDDGTMHLKGEKPVVLEDGIVECSALNVEAINQRTEDLGQAARGRDRLIVIKSIGLNANDATPDAEPLPLPSPS